MDNKLLFEEFILQDVLVVTKNDHFKYYGQIIQITNDFILMRTPRHGNVAISISRIKSVEETHVIWDDE